MKRTTILLDEALLLDARHLAQQQGTTFTALIDDALRAYIQARRAPRHLACLGIERSEQPTHTLRDGGDEAALRVGIDRVGGWSPRRHVSAPGHQEDVAGAAER